MQIAKGAAYNASAFFRSDPSSNGMQVKLQVNVSATAADQIGAATVTTPTATWTEATAAITTTVTDGVAVVLGATATADGCFDIDDAYLYQTN